MTERVSAVKLLPLDSAEAIELVAGWLSKYDNYKWLDFGNGVQRLTPVALRVMTQRALHEFRIYTADDGDVPAGGVGLTNGDRDFQTSSILAPVGNKTYGGSSLPACSPLLTLAFKKTGVEAANAWARESNI